MESVNRKTLEKYLITADYKGCEQKQELLNKFLDGLKPYLLDSDDLCVICSCSWDKHHEDCLLYKQDK